MKFRIDRDTLLVLARLAVSAAAKKGVHPVYESARIDATADGRLTFSATDLEMWLTASGRADVEAPGCAVLPASDLADLVAKLSPGDVAFECNDKKAIATVLSGCGRYVRHGCAPEDFPVMPECSASETTLPAEDFRRLVRSVAFAAAKERMRYALNGVLLKVEDEHLTMVATDGRRLSLDSRRCAQGGGPSWQAVIPTKPLRLAAEHATGDVALSQEKNHVRIESGNVAILSRLIDGTFPNYREGIIPVRPSRRFTVARADMLAALARASLSPEVENVSADVVRLSPSAAELVITTQTSSRSSEERIESEVTGKGTFGLDARLAREVLGALSEERVTFEWESQRAPIKIAEAASVHVIMPIDIT